MVEHKENQDMDLIFNTQNPDEVLQSTEIIKIGRLNPDIDLYTINIDKYDEIDPVIPLNSRINLNNLLSLPLTASISSNKNKKEIIMNQSNENFFKTEHDNNEYSMEMGNSDINFTENQLNILPIMNDKLNLTASQFPVLPHENTLDISKVEFLI